MKEILRPIYIEKEEGVGSVLGRIQKTSERNLALVFPPGSAIFNNVLEVEFLKKELDKLKKNPVIITSDPSQAELAKGLGLKSNTDIEKSKEADEFLEDFYKEKEEKKTVSPLIKPKMSDIVSQEKEIKPEVSEKTPSPSSEPSPSTTPKESEAVKINVSSQKKEKEEKPKEEREKTRLEASPEIEPISLTEKDLQKEAKKKKAPKKKGLHLKLKPKIRLAKLTESPFKKIFVILLLAAVGVFALTATFVFPRADIVVKPVKEEAQLNIDVVFNSDLKTVDFEKNVIPSQIFKLTKEASQEFSATKEADIRKKAEGMMTIYNAYSSESQTLVKTTRFRSPDGKIYRITKTITVPGAKIEEGKIIPSSIDALVVADEPGEGYNIGPTDFTIPGFKGSDKYEGFYGKNKKAITGGLIKKGLVVGENDINKAEDSLKSKLLEEAKSELKKQLEGDDFRLIEESLTAEIIEAKANPVAGEPADKFSFSLKVLAQGFAYMEEDLGDLVEEKIALKISDKRLTLPKTRKLSFNEQGIDFSSNKANFNLLVEESVSWKINEERLKEVLAGKSEAEASEAIKLFSEVESTHVSLWPFWLKRIPKDSQKIKVAIDYQ